MPPPETGFPAILVVGPDSTGLQLEVRDGRIVEARREPAPPPPGAVHLACSSGLIQPGAVNAHTHFYSGLASLGLPAPVPPPTTFLDRLRQVWWRLDRALDRRSLRAAARLHVARALLSGTTTLVDHSETPYCIEGSLDLLADVCDELGARAVLCYGATERNRGRAEARRGLAECRRFLEENRRPTVRGTVGLHASFTVSDETIREAGALCRHLDAVLHMHMAEDSADVADAVKRGYPGPLERLLVLDALPVGSILAHGVHLSEEQVRLATNTGAWLVQNPRSNLATRVGYPRALQVSRRVALGTDGRSPAMEEEEEVLRKEATTRGDSLEAAAARLPAGRELAGDRFRGSLAPLEPGALADLVVRESGKVIHVVVDGRITVRSGSLSGADMDAIRAEAEAAARRLWRRMEALP